MKNLQWLWFKSAVAISVGCLLLSPSIAFAWGAGGHMMTAYIAEGRLNPRAKAQGKALLALPIKPADVSRQSKDFVSAAHWADDPRSIPALKPWEPLHFIDNLVSTGGT